MAGKLGGLGKGLDALFEENATEEGIEQIRISDIERNPKQPRQNFDEIALEDLSASIRQHGVLQPILVRPTEKGYEIVAGERRWRAARLAGLTEIPALVRELDDEQVAKMALVENLQRTDLNPIEEAQGYESLMDEYRYTQDQVAKIVGKSRSAIANTTRLLSLPDIVRSQVAEGKLSSGHARALLAFESEEKIIAAANLVIEKGLTVRQAENLSKEVTVSEKKPRNHEIVEIETALKEVMGRKVSIKGNEKKGKIEIEYFDKKDLLKLAKTLEQFK